MQYIALFCIYNLNIFRGCYPGGLPQKRPRCMNPDTISAWLASVPIVPILRNDHCDDDVDDDDDDFVSRSRSSAVHTTTRCPSPSIIRSIRRRGATPAFVVPLDTLSGPLTRYPTDRTDRAPPTVTPNCTPRNAVVDREILKRTGVGERQCISPVVTYRKCTRFIREKNDE